MVSEQTRCVRELSLASTIHNANNTRIINNTVQPAGPCELLDDVVQQSKSDVACSAVVSALRRPAMFSKKKAKTARRDARRLAAGRRPFGWEGLGGGTRRLVQPGSAVALLFASVRNAMPTRRVKFVSFHVCAVRTNSRATCCGRSEAC